MDTVLEETQTTHLREEIDDRKRAFGDWLRGAGGAELVGEVGELAPDLVGFLTQLGARSRSIFESARELLEVHYSCRLALNRYESTHQIG